VRAGVARRSRGWAGVAIGLSVVLVAPAALDAQQPRTLVGVVGGWVQNRHVWSPKSATERVGGVMVGAFLRARTPASWLSVHAEGLWTQRGGDVFDDLDGALVRGSIRTDYLTLAVHPRLSVALGPARLHLAAGPTIDQILRSRLGPGLRMVLADEARTLFGVGAGVGVGTIVGGVHAEAEARLFEGLGDAYSGPFVSVRNRSFELLVRAGIPIG
jgi:hypothetical protein